MERETKIIFLTIVYLSRWKTKVMTMFLNNTNEVNGNVPSQITRLKFSRKIYSAY